jgi:hypothetical protein
MFGLFSSEEAKLETNAAFETKSNKQAFFNPLMSECVFVAFNLH